MQVTRLRAATYQSSLDEEKLHMKAEQLMIPSEQRPMPGWTKMHAPPPWCDLGLVLAGVPAGAAGLPNTAGAVSTTVAASRELD